MDLKMVRATQKNQIIFKINNYKMKFNVDSNEVQKILEMHSKLKKKPILEQNAPDADNDAKPGTIEEPKKEEPKKEEVVVNQDEIDRKFLKDSEAAGCFKNGTIKYIKGTKKPAYQTTTLKSNQVLIFYPDMTYLLPATGEKGKWKCSKAEQIKTQQAALKAQQDANTKDTNLVKTEGGWKEASEIQTTRENLENPKMFEKKVVNGVTLYRSVASSGIAGGLNDEQTKLIKKYTDLGYKLRKDLDSEQVKTWTSKVVSPASEGIFSQDLIMYFSPDYAVGSSGDKIANQFSKAVTSQTPTSKSDCRDTIRAYYEAWRTKKRIEPNTFAPMKEKVQACVNEFDGKWGGALSKIDNYVETLRGGSGGPLPYGDNSKWLLN
jgi:hypothetical protein